jgi:DNA-binding FadR family transcriptional regulator
MSTKQYFSKPIKKQTMAEQMADNIQESILFGELPGGAILPTEPELAQQFGVSRAVVRDATRILMARGLVQVEHGRGVFVTQPDNEAFGDALLLALRRTGASAWDVEQFDQIVFPEVLALAAANARDEEIAQIQQMADEYYEVVTNHHAKWKGNGAPAAEVERMIAAYQRVLRSIFAATHNRVFQQLARPLLRLRSLHNWAVGEGENREKYVEAELSYMRQLISAIVSRDPALARQSAARLMELPPEAIKAMRQTRVGEIVEIPIPMILPG